MSELTLENIKEVANNIISDYDKLRKGKIDISSFRSSAGYQISTLRKYELEDGHYGSRSVCILPDSIQIVDICLLYNTTEGPGRYILSIRPAESKGFIVYVNKLYLLNNDNCDEPFNHKTVKKSYKYRTKPHSSKSRSLEPIKSKGKTSTSSALTDEIYCPYKNLSCCYTKKDHKKGECKDCCYNEKHYKK